MSVDTHLFVQAIFQASTELPKDRFVNTFHFHYVDSANPGVGAAAVAGDGKFVAALVADFYGTNHSSTARVDSYLSSQSDRPVTLKVYDMAQPIPRPILYTGHYSMGTASGGRLPEEVALCASYYSARNLPRMRGRIYLGPFQVSVLNTDSTPNATFINAIKAASQNLLAGGSPTPGNTLLGSDGVTMTVTGGGTWSVYSRHDAHLLPVTNGWVDNEWDTQRRRRLKATARTSW